MKKEVVVPILVILILLGVLAYTYSLIQICTPPSNQYMDYVISGSINYSAESTGNKPHYVNVYYPYDNPDYLAKKQRINSNSAEINWIDNVSGEYEVYFEAPIGLKKVILNTDIYSCNYEPVNLTGDLIRKDLIWGIQKCESGSVSENITVLSKEVGNYLENNRRMLLGKQKQFNSSEVESIEADIDRGFDRLNRLSKYYKSVDYNESLLEAYYAYWFYLTSRYKIRLFELKYCLEQVDAILESHKNDSCYVPDNKAYDYYHLSNQTYSQSRALNKLPFHIDDTEKMKEEISFVDEYNIDRVSEANEKCKNSLSIINETFEFQKPYCEKRANAIYLFNFTWLLIDMWFIFVVLGIGILIGQRWRFKNE